MCGCRAQMIDIRLIDGVYIHDTANDETRIDALTPDSKNAGKPARSPTRPVLAVRRRHRDKAHAWSGGRAGEQSTLDTCFNLLVELARASCQASGCRGRTFDNSATGTAGHLPSRLADVPPPCSGLVSRPQVVVMNAPLPMDVAARRSRQGQPLFFASVDPADRRAAVFAFL